jgi:signal transduction histidine kinase
MLYPYSNLFPVSVVTGEAARKRLTERSRESLELYTEFLDLGRFSGEDYETLTAQYLVRKYRDRKPDLVMVLGPQALRFVITKRADLGFDGPVVFCCTSRARLVALNPPGDVTGIISEFDLTKTLALAQRLQPDASHIVVVAGATEFDRQWIQIARRQLAPYEQKYDTKYLSGLPHDDLMKELKRLPRDTIVILLTMFADSTGRLFISPEIVQDITSAATAPVYAPYETYVGRGIVGGHMDSLERIGDEIADLALDILAGASPSSLVPRATSGNADRVDWRQLQRWNISESRLPAGSEVRFHSATFWDQYRLQAMTALAVVLFQAALIAWLLFERHRRRAAELSSRLRLLEVIHLNRTATAGALSASVAHELNQPLGAILSNAEAAEVLLTANPPDVQLLREILADIRRDDQRAGEIIRRLRGMLRKSEVELQEFDLNETIDTAIHILEPEAIKRGIALSAVNGLAALPVRADQVHLQQVIINLAANGMDAMVDCGPGTRRLAFQTALVGDSEVEVSVADSGTGIPNDKLKDVFQTFFTTKPHGTGLGLSIARTIVETYGGRIWAENRPGGGAVFRFTLPLAQARAA